MTNSIASWHVQLSPDVVVGLNVSGSNADDNYAQLGDVKRIAQEMYQWAMKMEELQGGQEALASVKQLSSGWWLPLEIPYTYAPWTTPEAAPGETVTTGEANQSVVDNDIPF